MELFLMLRADRIHNDQRHYLRVRVLDGLLHRVASALFRRAVLPRQHAGTSVSSPLKS